MIVLTIIDNRKIDVSFDVQLEYFDEFDDVIYGVCDDYDIVCLSAKRVVEVLNEVPTVSNPKNPRMSVTDGSIVFEHVNFSYDKNGTNFVLTDINLPFVQGKPLGLWEEQVQQNFWSI